MCKPCHFDRNALQVQPVVVPLMCKHCRKHFSGNWVIGGLSVCPRCATEWVEPAAPAVEDCCDDDGVDCRVVWIVPSKTRGQQG